MTYSYDLGTHTRPITTNSPDAQIWFDRGLVWVYGFNHGEAVRCFEKAAVLDPECAMVQWGIAYAHGPYINKQWSYYGEQELGNKVAACHAASQRALVLSDNTTATERALIEALTQRYQSNQPVDADTFLCWNDDYAAAMRKVHAIYPEDLDVAALFVEAMMMRTPWKMWDIATGAVAENADTVEMMQVLTAGQRLIDENDLPPHPGLLHMHIHTLEMSAMPEKAMRSADFLRGLVPDAGHLLHMPGHIYALCGHYYDAIAISRQSIAADNKFLKQTGPYTQYTAACCHDLHMMMRTSMFLGQYKPGIEAANAITNLLTDDVLQHAQGQFIRSLEGYYSMKMHVHVRFGKWQAILDAAQPAPAKHPITVAMFLYARAIANAALGQHDAADREREAFQQQYDRIPASYYFFNNYAHSILDIARAMMDGELAYHRGDYAEAFDHLRLAVTRNDNLHYTEPWAWMHPPRHALGALLLAQGHVEEAESVYFDDLGFNPNIPRALRHPNNVWSLHGYAECLERLGKSAELAIIKPALDLAQSRTDTPVTASCACRIEPDCCCC